MNGTPDFDLKEYLPYVLTRLGGQMSRYLARSYEEQFGITTPEWRILVHLAERDDISVRELHHEAHLDRSTASRTVARLELRRLVQKKINKEDRRLVTLSITARGRRIVDKIAPLAQQFEADCLTVLSPTEAKTLRTALLRLCARLDEMESSET